ncbi:MAG: phenylalanine--tRNA ligase subunit beta, partial [Flavobacteriales bacterium]|nr:phenylalanine--tRNA ligase subunit beta [Flavobacteriales bacterium]
MKISYNWLLQYVRTSRSAQEIADVLTSTGLEVEAVEKVEAVKGGLRGVVVGEVLTCDKHPDADRLRVTTVNVGAGEPLQIVCGAPNVAAGQKVLVATIGTTLYPGGGEPLIIKKSKIRGVESQGMICAQDELGLGSDHAGIMVLDADAVVGSEASAFLNLLDDYCLEIGLTPNRTDAISHLGVANELAVALRYMEEIENEEAPVRVPVPEEIPLRNGGPVAIEILDTEACARYSGAVLDKVVVGPSPQWLQDRLTAIGLRPVNNIVDITNFVQHEFGQPLHAFDADKIGGQKIVVRRAKQDEPFVTLDGVERKLSEQDLVIADADVPMCLAGVFGGLHSGVGEHTTRIFLESAWFHPSVIRRTARHHVLHTDAAFRFE